MRTANPIIKALLACALVASACVAMAPSAQAAWTSNGPLTGVSATAGATSMSINASGGTVGVSCTGSTLTGGNLAGPTGPASGNWDVLTNLTLGFTGCTVAGLGANITCSAVKSTVTVTSYSAGKSTGFMKSLSCTIKPPSFPSCTITIVGSGTAGHAADLVYTNSVGTLLTLFAGVTVTATWSGCPFMNPTSGSGSVSIQAILWTIVSAPLMWLVR